MSLESTCTRARESERPPYDAVKMSSREYTTGPGTYRTRTCARTRIAHGARCAVASPANELDSVCHRPFPVSHRTAARYETCRTGTNRTTLTPWRAHAHQARPNKVYKKMGSLRKFDRQALSQASHKRGSAAGSPRPRREIVGTWELRRSYAAGREQLTVSTVTPAEQSLR